MPTCCIRTQIDSAWCALAALTALQERAWPCDHSNKHVMGARCIAWPALPGCLAMSRPRRGKLCTQAVHAA